MTDLFSEPKPLTMRDRVLAFIKDKHYASSIDLQGLVDKIKREEGIVPGLLRIPREARSLAQSGIIKRLSKEEKIFRFSRINPKFAIYEYVGKI